MRPRILPRFGLEPGCWVLATEYIVDFRGEEMQVGLFNVVVALGLWAVLILGMVATWRALNKRGLGSPEHPPTKGKNLAPGR